MAELLNGRVTESVMAFPRIVDILVGAITRRGSALWLYAIAPLAGLIGVWGALTVVHALVVAVTAVLAVLITTASALVAADWRADADSRQGWAQGRSAAAEFCLPFNAGAPGEIDPRYLPAGDNGALRSVFRAHRFVSATPALEATTHRPGAICASRMVVASVAPFRPAAALQSAPRVAGKISTSAPSDLAMESSPYRKAARASCGQAPLVLASRRARQQISRAEPAVSTVRLVANGDPWSERRALDRCILTRAPPDRHIADIVVLNGDRGGRDQPDFPGPSTCDGTVKGDEPPSCRGPPPTNGKRRRPTETVPVERSAEGSHKVPAVGALRPADPVVRDNLGHQVPVCAAELVVIETYLEQVLREVLATVRSDQDSQTS